MTKISELMDMIEKRDLVLPEFQREYVWSREQAKQLIVSLMREYPVGGLLFWKTDKPPELKNVDRLPEHFGATQVILDGQQRLTTLYLLVKGKIPPYYREEDIRTDPRDLYYNLVTGEIEYYQASKMKNDPLWRRVVDCFISPDDINVFELAKRAAVDDKEAFERAQLYNHNLSRLSNIVKVVSLPVQTVPPSATLEEAIDIFDRVNSQGTKLTDAELALTHVTGKWPNARRQLKAKIDQLSRKHFYFDLTFMTRALTVVVTRHALFEKIHSVPRPELEAGWKALTHILDYLTGILPQHAFIHSTEDLSTTNVLIPLIAYLSFNGGKFADYKSIQHAIHWLYAAHMWARYSGQTDQRLEHDVLLVMREDHPWTVLLEQIVDQRGRIEVKSSDFEGRGAQHPLYHMVYILTKAHGALDWFNGSPLGGRDSGSYQLHSHHIFPQKTLYENGFDPENHIHRKIVNEIANLAFLTAESNLELGKELPETYLPKVEECYPGALAKQFIPMEPELWKLGRFHDFLEARRQLLALKLNEYMRSLVQEPIISKERPLTDLIAQGEGLSLEFKSTLQWDVVSNGKNEALRHSVLKTLAAFLNTEGGTLLIGIEDHGAVYGLERDLALLGGSLDRFQQLLATLILDSLGASASPLIKTRFEDIENHKVCVIDVDKSPDPVFLKGGKESKEFYVRIGTTTHSLDPQQTLEYIQINWRQV